jgi:hypothetical protein
MRGIQKVVLAFLLAAPTMGWAATPAKPAATAKSTATPAKPVTSSSATPVTIKRVPMSQEGNAIISRINASPDTRIAQIQGELRSIRAQYLQFVSGGPVDLEKLDASLRRELALTAEARARDNDRLLMILRALSETDRVAYLQRSIQVTRQPGPAAAAKPSSDKPAAGTTPVVVTPAPAPAATPNGGN